MGLRRAAAAASLVVGVLAGAPAARAQQPVPPPVPCPAIALESAAFAGIVDRRWPGHHITAAVHDERTGCTYHFRPEHRVGTASVLKMQLYAGILLRAQQQGRPPTAQEVATAWPMITESTNPEATSFWNSLGGEAGMRSLNATFGMTETTPATPWGRTATSAMDQVRLLRQVVVGAYGPLTAPYRAYLVDAMEHVVPSQRWGIGAEVPPDRVFANKNGFAYSTCCGWRINSVGFVPDPAGGGYSVAILSDGWGSQPEGVVAVDYVGAAIANDLAPSPFGPFPSRRAFVARQYADLCGRGPDLEGALGWARAAGWSLASAGTALDGMFGAGESGRGELVVRAYQSLLGRRPDPAGLRGWRAWMRTGRTEAALFATIATTPEFQGAVDGLDDTAVVDLLYRRALGRGPDPVGGAHWRAALATLGPAGVALAIASSAEGRARLDGPAAVLQVYDALLGRLAAASEVDAWVGATGGRRAAIAAGVLGSGEYRARVTASA